MNRWQVQIMGPARQDFYDIIRWTRNKFGNKQAAQYRALIQASFKDLENGPNHLMARHRPDLGPSIYTLQIARVGKPGNHLLLYQPGSRQTIKILRILHESMDIGSHVAPD